MITVYLCLFVDLVIIFLAACKFLNPDFSWLSHLQILRQCGGSVELIDVSSELPQLVRRPGLKKWKVSTNKLMLNNSYT